MSDVTLEAPAPDDASSGVDSRIDLGWAVAGMSAAAAIIHFAMVPVHGADSTTDAVLFAIAGMFQLVVAGAIIANRASRDLYKVAIVGNLVIIAAWVWSRTAGLPWGAHSGIAEDATAIDIGCTLLQVGIVLVSARLLMSEKRVAVGKLGPVLAGIGALGLASVLITSPSASQHNHSHDTTATGLTGHAALMAKLDRTRCDKGFNIDGYWNEAKYLNIDTYQGGQMSMTDDGSASQGATSSDGHSHSHGAAAPAPVPASTTTTDPDPTGGRGSKGLDKLVTLTSQSDGGEVAAARMVVGLSMATDADYDAWLWWLRSSGALSHAHAATAGSGATDDTGHGGHVGPQPWTAMTDQKQCNKLGSELALARKTALKYPTAADASAAGWVHVTGYVPGIAAHYIKGALVDDKFEIDQPEMLLYDGDGPDAHIVGLSYYVRQDGNYEPTQGFTGANDHSHRHVGLCIGRGGVIGDTTTTEAECAARGGKKDTTSNAWMYHAWVVPGCESPWGVFSAASPLIDITLEKSSGKTGIGCAASGVRARYNMGTGAQPASTRGGG